MARKKKNTVDYFPHECSHGQKMFIVETQFGNDGYAVWFKVLEQLGLADNHYLDLRDDSQYMYLSSVCRVDENRFKDIVNLLSKIGAINKTLWENNIIFSEKFMENIEDAYKRRNNKCIQFDDLCKHLNIKCKQKTTSKDNNADISTQSKVDYSKIEESKVNKKTKKELPTKVGDILLEDFIGFWEKQTGKEINVTQMLVEKLKKILKEKHTKEDIATVVINKSKEWKNNEAMHHNLKVSTLLGINNFKKYLADGDCSQFTGNSKSTSLLPTNKFDN